MCYYFSEPYRGRLVKATVRADSVLGRLYGFFELYGAERLTRLDHLYFDGLSNGEKEDAWNFLSEGFARSSERMDGLYIIDPTRATELFKEAIADPVEPSPYAVERQALATNRLLMLKHIGNVEPDKKYVDEISKFAKARFPKSERKQRKRYQRRRSQRLELMRLRN